MCFRFQCWPIQYSELVTFDFPSKSVGDPSLSKQRDCLLGLNVLSLWPFVHLYYYPPLSVFFKYVSSPFLHSSTFFQYIHTYIYIYIYIYIKNINSTHNNIFLLYPPWPFTIYIYIYIYIYMDGWMDGFIDGWMYIYIYIYIDRFLK